MFFRIICSSIRKLVEGIRDYSKDYDAKNLIECIVSRDEFAGQVSARLDDGKWSKNRCKVLLSSKQADRQTENTS